MSRSQLPILIAVFTLWMVGAVHACHGSEPPPPDVSGRWAMIQIMPALADLPFLGRVTLTTTTALFVDITQSGRELAVSESYVFTDVTMTPALIESSIPSAFIASLDPTSITAQLVWNGRQWRYQEQSHLEIRGASLENPAIDPLPRDPYDPRVIDQDNDGYPGLTVPVSLVGLVDGETYVVQRLMYALDGDVLDTDTIAGSIDWTSQQNVLAASDLLLTLSYSYEPHPDRTLHRFVMARVDGSWDAETLRSHLGDILERDTR